jgi:hypothetical protein
MAVIELNYDPSLISLLDRGDGVLLGSNTWERATFERRIYKVLSHFPELRDTPILIHFTHHLDYSYKALATMRPPRSHIDWDLVVDWDELRLKYPDSFFIIIYRPFYELDEIAQILNYSHEFQHVSQFMAGEKYYWLSRIMCHLVDGLRDEELPTEIDAEITSKKVLCELYGKKVVDEWTVAQLGKYAFFTRFKKINSDVTYDFKKEVAELWRFFGLDERIEKLEKCETKDENQDNVLNMYYRAMKAAS